MSLKEFFEWASMTWLGEAMRNSLYAYPAVEIVHLIGLAVVLGSMLLFNLRYFGMGMRRQTVGELAKDLAPWTGIAFLVMASSGVPMFASRAPDIYDFKLSNYIIKMSLIAVAVILFFLVQRPFAIKHPTVTWRGRFLALIALGLWFGAAIEGLTLEFL